MTNCRQIGTIPVSPSTVCRHVRIVFMDSHFYQISLLCSGQFPLFPYTHAYSVIEPSVDVIYVVLHTCNSVVVKPSSCIHLDFLKACYPSYLILSTSVSFFRLLLKTQESTICNRPTKKIIIKIGTIGT